jgi:Cdc6-like AAA superfamily ATPase
MDTLNINYLLHRVELEKQFIDYLTFFENNKHSLLTKRGVYIYGNPGSGKTAFVSNVLKKMNYDIIKYDAGDVRNKNIIEQITNQYVSDVNVMSLFTKKKKKIAIMMDEIDGMNSGDKGGINALIKLVRPKKTKKQKKESTTMIPIICIGNYHIDKKITDMMKVCNTIEISTPTNVEISNIIHLLMPKLDDILINKLIDFIQGDLRKLKSTHTIYVNQQEILKNEIIRNLIQPKNYSEDTKSIVRKILANKHLLSEHQIIMNETDRTSVGLLYHENIVDTMVNDKKEETLNLYINILDNICFSDYIDRITFQKQIWIFNEISSLIKTFYNNYLLYKNYENKEVEVKKLKDIRFTKVLTKYSTEYNNSIFIQLLCRQLNLDKKDMLYFFIQLRETYSIDDIIAHFENDNNFDINKLDIRRIYRYIDNII